ncbi:solute carrier family 22 member 14 [Molossus molossus]|uniref:solute carrier family 22 member 14 n=1 Tax=Molossus molossus TaxID=27622 RepID=UPI00174645BC|nr:solute carrier family 22 member 14 [Molossus molossus]
MAREGNFKTEPHSQPPSSSSNQQEAGEHLRSWSLEKLLRKLKATETDLDDKFTSILNSLGHFGTFQQKLVALTLLPNLLSAFFMFADIFVFTVPKPYCNTSWILAVGPNLTEAEQLNLTLPRDTNGSFLTCLMYVPVTWDLDDIIQFGLNYTQSCSNGWIYPESKRRSVINEFDLVCGEELNREAVHTTILAGLLIGSLTFGFISDKLGRYTSILLSILGLMIFGFGTAFVGNLNQYLFFRFGVSQALVGFSINSVSLASEWLVGEHRAHAIILGQCFYPLGIMLLTALAYSVPHWRLLFLLGGSLVFSLIFYICILPESPRWLMMKGQVEEAKRVLCFAARENKKNIPLSLLGKLHAPGKKATKASVLDFYNNRQLRKVILAIGCVGFTAGHSYFTLSLKMRDFDMNLYISQMVSAMMELPARLGSIFLFEQFGRKWTLAVILLQGTFMNFLVLNFPSGTDDPKLGWSCCLPTDLKSVVVLMVFVGRFSLSAWIAGFFTYTAELLPTVLRTTGLGLGILAWASGAILSITLINQSLTPLSSSLCLISTICSLSLCYMLPETYGQPLVDSLEHYCLHPRTMSDDLDDDLTADHALCDVTTEVAKNTILNVTMNLNPRPLNNTSLKAEEKFKGRRVTEGPR